MKKIIVIFGSLLFMAQMLCAEDEKTEQSPAQSSWTPSVTLSSLFATKYDAFGSGYTLYNKPVLQSDIFVICKNGFYLDLWNSTSFEGYNQNFGTEQDWGIGWSGKLSTFGLKGAWGDIKLDIGSTFFDEPGLLKIGAWDVLDSHAKISKDFKWFTVYGTFENYLAMPGSPYVGGNIYSAGVSKSVCLIKDVLSGTASVALSYDDGGFGLGDGFLFRGSVELDWSLTKRLTLVLPRVNYYVPINLNDARSPDAVVFAGLIYKF